MRVDELVQFLALFRGSLILWDNPRSYLHVA